MKTAISTFLFFIVRARELNCHSEIKFNNEDLQVIRAFLSVSSEFISDQIGLELLLTCTKEMLYFARNPGQHCINADDFSVVAMTIDPKQFEANLVTISNISHLNQLKSDIMADLRVLLARHNRVLSPERYDSARTELF